ncbi:MAG: TldD/PmbA family protein, partial [Candidatus Bathyarchaeota archaeon]
MNPDENWNLLSSFVHKAIRLLEKKAITHAEAFFTSTHATEVAIRNSEIHTQNRADDCGVGFRVAIATNRVGFACTNTLKEKAVLETAEKAFDVARVSSEEVNFALPEACKPPEVKGLFDSRVVQMDVEEGVDVARRLIQAAEDFDKRVVAKDGRVLFEFGWRGIVNTFGVDFEERETEAIIYLGGGGEQDGEVTSSCFDVILSRTAEVEPEKVGENVGRMVIAMFKPHPLKGFQGTAVFGPEVAANHLFVVLVDALNGGNVVAGRSAWTGKLGQNVASENMTVTDDALAEKGFASRSFDDEGARSQNTVLIRKGKLESFLHNATSANALKTRNTGNASRFSSGFDMVRSI